jgi:peptidoglycan-N-acetylglucosamine deacetylase
MCRALRKTCLTFSVITFAGLNACAGQGPPQSQPSEFWGFTGPWETASTQSVRAHGGQLHAVVNGWITIDSASALPVIPSPYPDTVRPLTGTPQRMAIVTSWHGDRFHTASIRLLGRDPERLAKTAGAIGQYSQSMRYSGLVLDFESLMADDLPLLVRVSKAIADSARARGVRTIAMAIPATDADAYPARSLLGAVDALVVMLYDQHWDTSEPGPIAEPSWVRSALQRRVAEAGAARLIAGLPAYGYRWRKGASTESIGYAEAVTMANAAGAPLSRDEQSHTLRSRDASGNEIWVADAGLLRALVDQSLSLRVNRIAIWRLGQEDPAIWRSVIR